MRATMRNLIGILIPRNIFNEMEKIAPRFDGVKQHPMHESISYLSVYWVDRCFGGNEEGGWWYDNCVHVYSEPINPCMITMEQMEARQEQLKEKFNHMVGGEPRGNVNGSADIEVYFETTKKSRETKSTPYYS